MRRLPQTSVFTGAARLERMEKMNDEFKEFNKIYKKKLEEVQKENKITDLFEQVDEALKRAKHVE
jgi:dTDP-4-amino-4,6-dideoxygalactose transaminase